MKKYQYFNKRLFLDIETVANSPSYRMLDERMKYLWDCKSSSLRLSANGSFLANEDLYEKRAGIYAEFSKIICISTLTVFEKDGEWQATKKNFYQKKEKELLSEFKIFLDRDFQELKSFKIIGHNIKEFDIPFIARRMIVNELILPKALMIAGKKSWQIDHLKDTMDLWKFGDYKNYTSLNLLAKILNVPSPKEDLDGSKIHNAYWLNNNMKAIVEYCELDVLTTMKVYFKLKQLSFSKKLMEDLDYSIKQT